MAVVPLGTHPPGGLVSSHEVWDLPNGNVRGGRASHVSEVNAPQKQSQVQPPSFPVKCENQSLAAFHSRLESLLWKGACFPPLPLVQWGVFFLCLPQGGFAVAISRAMGFFKVNLGVSRL